MAIVTISSLAERTGPASVVWVTAGGIPQRQQLCDVRTAIELANKLSKDETVQVWVEPATGPIYYPEDESE